MDILELSKQRFSVRKFTDEPVSKEDLEYILETVRMAPSACNRQPLKLILVESEEAKVKLRQCYDRGWFDTAPLYVLVMRNTEENWVRPADGKPHGDIDVAIATEHLCLAATEKGLGSCWVCNFNPEKVREFFPRKNYEAVVIVPIGHIAPDCPHPEKRRKPLSDITEEV